MGYEEVKHSLEDVAIDNAIALLDELLQNANLGPESLYVWAQEGRRFIETAIDDLKWLEDNRCV